MAGVPLTITPNVMAATVRAARRQYSIDMTVLLPCRCQISQFSPLEGEIDRRAILAMPTKNGVIARQHSRTKYCLVQCVSARMVAPALIPHLLDQSIC